MRRILFAGPSLHGLTLDVPDVEIRPPAAQGDLQRAVLDGADVIGLVDGLYESVAAVWHKEILFALSQGVSVLGGASMGALRAAECCAFGMVPVGEIAGRYASGALDDDAAVAQLHAPAELGFRPLTEALVDCEATLQALHRAGRIGSGEEAILLRAAGALFFKDRTWPAILGAAELGAERTGELAALLRQPRPSLKRADALLVLQAVAAVPDPRRALPRDWHLAEPRAWRRSLAATRAASG